MSRLKFLSFVAFVALLSGCAKDQILVEVYSPPKEMKKVEGMVSKNSKDGQFLVLGINPEVKVAKTIVGGKSVEKYLVSNIQEMLTQTNFFTIHPIYGEAKLNLDMEILDYKFVEGKDFIDADLAVDFIISKDSVKYFSKTYNEKVKLQSQAGRQALASKNTILADMAKSVCEDFAKDISPLRTKKLVEMKKLPDAISYTVSYAISGNYQGAIDAMEKYSGKKTLEYHFNLAIYYEALAAKNESLELLKKASQNYEQAVALGGATDELVLKEKAKFDNFYNLFKMIESQRLNNVKKTKSINDEFGISK